MSRSRVRRYSAGMVSKRSSMDSTPMAESISVRSEGDFGGVGESELDDPGVVGGGVDGLRRSVERLVDFSNSAGDGGVEVAHGFDGFDRAEGGAGLNLLAYLGQFDENDVAERALGVV